MPIKIPRGIFVEVDKLILKYVWKSKGIDYPKLFWGGKGTKLKDLIYLISRLSIKLIKME